ncbi:MAG: ABC transporter transmembrane domain-containing protein [Stappiaceae bacterium]
MDKTLFGFIWKYTKRQQIVVLMITVLSFPLLYYTLELPKLIVNDAIDGQGFPREILGFELGQINYLLALCFAFLALVIINNGIKYVLNVYKGRLGERMLRRLRYDLFQRVLRFRLPQFRRVSSGEIIPMITAEVEDLGPFIGGAIALPAFQGGTLVVYITFIFMQDPLLGLAAISLYPLQGYIIPKLQKKVIRLSRQRVQNVRKIADKVGEGIAGVVEIHANDTSAFHQADLSERLFENYQIRLDIFKRKFMIKFINNFMNQLTPFLFYLIGGYLVIQGDLSFGALVAVLAAYKDLAGPWKELLAYYQVLADVQVKYQTVVENFDPPDIYPVERITSDELWDLKGNLKFSGVNFSSGSTGQEVFSLTTEIPHGAKWAIAGDDASGRGELLQLAAGLVGPDAGRVEIGEYNLENLPEATLGRTIAYAGPSSHIFTGTIRDNLYYGLRHRPMDAGEEDELRINEAQLTANSDFDIKANWDDYVEAGAESPDDLAQRALELVDAVGMTTDIYRMGLQSNLDSGSDSELTDRILAARRAIADKVAGDKKVQDLVELWDMNSFNRSATLAENLLFAAPADPEVDIDRIPEDPVVQEFLIASGLQDRLSEIGLKVADTMVDLFSNISADSTLLGNFSFMSAEEVPEYEALLRKASMASGQEGLSKEEKARLVGLAFKLIPARHRLGVITGEIEEEIVAARHRFHKEVGTADGRFVLFDANVYMPPLSIEDNLLFGRARVDRRDSRERIDNLIGNIVLEQELRQPILMAGLEFEVGVHGSRLSSSQRRKIALVRVLLKRPKYLVLDEVATSASDEDRHLREIIRNTIDDGILIFGTSHLSIAEEFPHIVVMKGGKIAENKTNT